ncbi:MAG: glycoside hydrolase family 3 C-terminal domain-containing protein [Clostridiales bacterium]|nr:glycoside hydrolase family 3 C-terminal domain-containing protein [Clostridiales bacterium]
MSEKSYKERSSEFRKKAEELVSKMTLEEAASQLSYQAPPIKRLGIPAYNWWNEGLHGVARGGVATMFPQAIGLAASFDEDVLRQMGEVVAQEGRAKYNQASIHGDHGIFKGLTFWTPNVNIFRDPRWGRGQETYGEDPYLTSRLAKALILALQGDGTYMKAAACAKHFAVHSGPEGIRHSFDAKADSQDLWDTYLPAFETCVREAGVEGVMGAYNRTNGEPCCAHTRLQEILRKEWNFEGYFVSDCWAIRDFHENHMVTESMTESAALALENGCDLNCGCTYLYLMKAYEEGRITEEQIRRSAVRLFTTRYRLGLFDESCDYNAISYLENDTESHHQTALEHARKSMVLLKNDGILPLSKEKINCIAVIGPNAFSLDALRGNYYGTPSSYVTDLQGIQAMAGDSVRVLYSEGCPLTEDRKDLFSEAAAAAECADLAVVCLGLDATIEGEEGDTGNSFAAGDKTDLLLPKIQRELLERILETKTPVILVNHTGSAMDLRIGEDHCAAVIQAWYGGAYGGQALAELLFGAYSPSGRLPVTFYESVEQLPDFEDYSMDNRTYRYFKGRPLYPFGYGLSYTHFSYHKGKAERREETVTLSVTVTNDGGWDGGEVTQIYIVYPPALFRVPQYALAGFRYYELKHGESEHLNFELQLKQLEVIGEDGQRVRLNGTYRFFVGGSQPDIRSRELLGNMFAEYELLMTEEDWKGEAN